MWELLKSHKIYVFKPQQLKYSSRISEGTKYLATLRIYSSIHPTINLYVMYRM